MQVCVLHFVRAVMVRKIHNVITAFHMLRFLMAHVAVVSNSGMDCNVMSTKECETHYVTLVPAQQREIVLNE